MTSLAYAGDAKSLLAKQICSPVRWETIVRHMIGVPDELRGQAIKAYVAANPGYTHGKEREMNCGSSPTAEWLSTNGFASSNS